MTRPRSTLRRIDDAIARFEEALEALRQIPKEGHGVTVDGIEHELIALAKRLQSLRVRWPVTLIGPSEAPAQYAGQRQILGRVAGRARACRQSLRWGERVWRPRAPS
jgi:hypothetical protein